MNIKAAYEAVSDVIGMAIFFAQLLEAVDVIVRALLH